MRERFEDRGDISRVLNSWRSLDAGVELDKPYSGDPNVNPYLRQQARSFLDGLTARPFWDIDEKENGMGWARNLEQYYDVIRDEFMSVTASPDDLASKGNNVWAMAADSDSAASYGPDWKTLVLMDRTTWDPTNSQLFPKTTKAIVDAGIPCVEAFFAQMPGDTKINVHTDSCNFILTSHLALVVPENGNNKCRLTVGPDTREWLEGTSMVFDTSIFHDAINESDGTRYILMLRVWHPELMDVERDALQFTFDCLDVPGLTSDDPAERWMAEKQVELMRAVPLEVREQQSEGGEERKLTKKELKKQKKKGGGGFGK